MKKRMLFCVRRLSDKSDIAHYNIWREVKWLVVCFGETQYGIWLVIKFCIWNMELCIWILLESINMMEIERFYQNWIWVWGDQWFIRSSPLHIYTSTIYIWSCKYNPVKYDLQEEFWTSTCRRSWLKSNSPNRAYEYRTPIISQLKYKSTPCSVQRYAGAIEHKAQQSQVANISYRTAWG